MGSPRHCSQLLLPGDTQAIHEPGGALTPGFPDNLPLCRGLLRTGYTESPNGPRSRAGKCLINPVLRLCQRAILFSLEAVSKSPVAGLNPHLGLLGQSTAGESELLMLAWETGLKAVTAAGKNRDCDEIRSGQASSHQGASFSGQAASVLALPLTLTSCETFM